MSRSGASTPAALVGVDDVIAKLDTRSDEAVVIACCADSTADGPDTYYSLAWRQLMDEVWPERRALYYDRWAGGEATDGSYDPPVQWQEGTSNIVAPLVDVFLDTFTRSGDLRLSSPDIGGAWGGTAAMMTTDGAVASLTGAAYVNQPTTLAHNGMDFTLTVSSKSTTITSVTRTTIFYAAYIDNNNYIKVTLDVRANAVFNLFLAVKASGTERNVGIFPGGTIPNNVAVNDITTTISVDGVDISATVNANTVNGVLTGAEITALQNWSKAGLYVDDSTFEMDNFRVQAREITGTVAIPDVSIYNPAVPGSRADHHINRLPIVYPVRPDVLFFGHGHNYASTLTTAEFIAEVAEFISAFHALHPGVPIVILSENPQFSPMTSGQVLITRMKALRTLARQRGWLYIGTLEAVAELIDGGMSVTNVDGLHPEPAGSQVQADEIKRVIKNLSVRNT